MSSYNRADMVCFHGDSRVELAGGKAKKACEVMAGDAIASGGIVKCVVKTVIKDSHCELVRLPSGLLITAWHPVKVHGEWCFPADIGVLHDVPCDAVYSYVIEKASSAPATDNVWPYEAEVIVNGTICATLGHGIVGKEKISHPFFGTAAVVDALRQCEGWERGRVTFWSNITNQDSFLLRDSVTSLVTGLDRARAVNIDR